MQQYLKRIIASTAFITASSISILLNIRPAAADPSLAFQPILIQLRKQLSKGMVIRLPVSLETMVSEGGPTQLYPLPPDNSEGLFIPLTMTPGCDALGCLWGYIAAYPRNSSSSNIDISFHKKLNLYLGSNVRANYFESGCGYYNPRIGRGSYRRITWEQNNTVFVTQEGCHSEPNLDLRAKQTLIARASSMASEPPIQSIYNAQYYKEQGDTHYDQRSWPQAITAYTEALTLSPRYAAIYYNRGMAHHYNGQNQQAITNLQKAAQLYLEQGKGKDRQDALDAIQKVQTGH
jgi:tetratricopeptide (TPR) repeat protein